MKKSLFLNAFFLFFSFVPFFPAVCVQQTIYYVPITNQTNHELRLFTLLPKRPSRGLAKENWSIQSGQTIAEGVWGGYPWYRFSFYPDTSNSVSFTLPAITANTEIRVSAYPANSFNFHLLYSNVLPADRLAIHNRALALLGATLLRTGQNAMQLLPADIYRYIAQFVYAEAWQEAVH